MNIIKARGVYMQTELKVVVINPPTERDKEKIQEKIEEYLESVYERQKGVDTNENKSRKEND